jgi:hypothetical protein
MLCSPFITCISEPSHSDPLLPPNDNPHGPQTNTSSRISNSSKDLWVQIRALSTRLPDLQRDDLCERSGQDDDAEGEGEHRGDVGEGCYFCGEG